MRIQRGFTLIELAIVTAITIALLGFITISLIRSQQSASSASVEEILLADLKQQQLKAMIGDTEGRLTSDAYGVHFDSNRYILFHGAVYSPSDSSNYVTNLESDMQFNNPNYDILFSRMNGEIQTATIIELQDNANSGLKRIHLNPLGVAVQVESL